MFFKFVILTKKFKEKNQCYITKTFPNAMIQNIKIVYLNTQFSSDIIEISKCMGPNKCTQYIYTYENIYLNVTYDFSKFDEFNQIKKNQFFAAPF